MDTLGNRDIRFVFPPVMSNPKTRLILKTPKTATSVRRVWLPKTLAYILREWRDTQQKQKEFLGDEYFDYDLVVAHYNGRPCDCKNIEKSFNRLKEDAGLPNVVFHSLRHSSTTYKLKLNHGDIKATQGDTGHAQADMITRVYAHILDEDRKVNAQGHQSMPFFICLSTDRGCLSSVSPILETGTNNPHSYISPNCKGCMNQ